MKKVGKGGLFIFFLCFVPGVILLTSSALIKVYEGPFGGAGGVLFERLIPHGSRITEIQIRAGVYIEALQIFYEKKDGRLQDSSRIGGHGGQLYRFKLDKGEYIIGISGRYGQFVDSIRIHTNRRVSPRYGGIGGTHNYRAIARFNTELIGFFGRSGLHVDAIGIVVRG
ncbi:MAG: jacalin-like lectin [Amphritea sp.]